mgnify:CR=1 FL=1
MLRKMDIDNLLTAIEDKEVFGRGFAEMPNNKTVQYMILTACNLWLTGNSETENCKHLRKLLVDYLLNRNLNLSNGVE